MLSAEKLHYFDTCPRKYAFTQGYESKIISPLGLLYAALEVGICADEPEQAAKDRTLEIAKEFELDAGEHNRFLVVRHVGFLAGIISMALRERLGILAPVTPTKDWESALFETQAGVRHRIELVSAFDDDRLRQSAHSWGVIGELAALEKPLTLTAVVIGAHRGGRRHSAWSKGYLHPQNHTLRFARRGQKGFSDGWDEVWRDHRTEISTEKWLEAMKSDAALDGLILSREIAYNASDARMIAARKEMRILEKEMGSAREDSPMRRSSCDEVGRGACPFQSVCWSPVDVTPDQLVHLYRKRAS